jgi:hypothetical protein
MQEIKFEPNVMCEHIDKKATFRASQVYNMFLLVKECQIWIKHLLICKMLQIL